MSGTDYGVYGDDGSYSDPLGTSVGPLFDAATSLGSGSTYYTPKTSDTATTTAVQSMAPVTAQNTSSDSGMSGFWTALGKAVNTGVQVIAVKNGVSTTQTASGSVVAAPTTSLNTMLLLAGIAVVALIVMHKD